MNPLQFLDLRTILMMQDLFMKNLFTDCLRTKKHLLKTEIFSSCSSALESTSKA